METPKLWQEVFRMGKTHAAYSPEFRRHTVKLVRAGRDPKDLARDFVAAEYEAKLREKPQ